MSDDSISIIGVGACLVASWSTPWLHYYLAASV
jgi:hypothetical protein